MKNKLIKLHDGTQIRINDDEWLSVANCKVFDEKKTEIIRVTRCASDRVDAPSNLVRVYSMSSVNGKIESERNEIVLPGGDIKGAVNRAVEVCGLGEEIAKKALAAL
jgi:hypothetical protein